MSEGREGRYVLMLTVSKDVPTRAGPVQVTWPDSEPVEAEVLGCDFGGVDAFMDEREVFDDLLAACRRFVGRQDRGQKITLGDLYAARKAAEKAEAAR